MKTEPLQDGLKGLMFVAYVTIAIIAIVTCSFWMYTVHQPEYISNTHVTSEELYVAKVSSDDVLFVAQGKEVIEVKNCGSSLNKDDYIIADVARVLYVKKSYFGDGSRREYRVHVFYPGLCKV